MDGFHGYPNQLMGIGYSPNPNSNYPYTMVQHVTQGYSHQGIQWGFELNQWYKEKFAKSPTIMKN